MHGIILFFMEVILHDFLVFNSVLFWFAGFYLFAIWYLLLFWFILNFFLMHLCFCFCWVNKKRDFLIKIIRFWTSAFWLSYIKLWDFFFFLNQKNGELESSLHGYWKWRQRKITVSQARLDKRSSFWNWVFYFLWKLFFMIF